MNGNGESSYEDDYKQYCAVLKPAFVSSANTVDYSHLQPMSGVITAERVLTLLNDATRQQSGPDTVRIYRMRSQQEKTQGAQLGKRTLGASRCII